MNAIAYTPRPAQVSADDRYSNQRRYGADDFSSHGLRIQNEREYRPEVTVYRDGETDVAELQIDIGLFTRASVTVRLTPSELREVAARLLDAAHDIETLPAAVLIKAAA